MSHRPITEDDLNGFIDETLDARRRAEIVAYLEAHPDMAKRVAGMSEQRDMLRAALAPVAEEPLPPELDLARLVEARWRPTQLPRWAAAAAAIALVVLGGAGGWSLRGLSQTPHEGVAALAHEALASYAVYAPDRVRPVEIRADERAQLVDWVSQRLGRPVTVPDLSGSDYRFMGGRIVATAHGPAALFMYDDDKGSRLVMLARPMTVDANAAMARHTANGVSGFSWSDKGLGYSLVGARPADALHPLADAARRQIRDNA